MEQVTIQLLPQQFREKEQVLASSGSLKAVAFRYTSGVCGLKLQNKYGELVMLPFQGQQIWRASFKGTDLTMQSVFPEPEMTTDYLATYGGFLIHCGMTAMGNPGPEDSHPLHGELPNLAYRDARLILGTEDGRPYIGLTGSCELRQAFSIYYRAEPLVKLFFDATTVDVSLKVTNLRALDLPYMYLCHINFLLVEGSQLFYSAPADKEHVRAHLTIPDDLAPEKAKKLQDYILALQDDPSLHDLVDTAKQTYEPEVVFTVDYLADQAGWAYTIQELPSQAAFYVAHRTAELPLGLRWIAKSDVEAAMGMVLPATAEHFGLHQAKAKGQVKTLAGNSSVTFQMQVGYLDKEESKKVKDQIEAIL